MDLTTELEYPLPILNVDKDKIYLETSESIEGSFIITNKGSSELNGKIISGSKHVEVIPEKFSGNEVKIRFIVKTTSLRPKENIETFFIISSNGGEKEIKVTIKGTSPFLKGRNNVKIKNLNEFYKFSIENPIEARFIFSSQDFSLWLFESGYKNLEVYDRFAKDANKERALENFFLANNIKKKSIIEIEKDNILITLEPWERNIFLYKLKLNKIGDGYTKTKLKIKNSSPWIALDLNELSSTDFKNDKSKIIDLYINPKYIRTRFVSEKLILEDYNKEINISVQTKKCFYASLSKNSFKFEDKGTINIENLTGQDVMFEIMPKDNFLKLEGKKYFVGKSAKIPFEIKMSPIVKANLTLKNKPVVDTRFYIRMTYRNIVYMDKLNINIGSFY